MSYTSPSSYSKNTIILLIVLGGVIINFIHCKKDKHADTSAPAITPITTAIVTGKIILPVGVTLTTSALTVHSPIANSQVNNDEFSIKCYSSTFNTTLAINDAGNVVLMGYNSPNATNNDISIESTAIAMVMNSPLAIYLSAAGKTQLLSNLKTEPTLSGLEQEIQNNLSTNRNLFDTTNTNLINKANLLFNSPTLKSSQVNGSKKTVTDLKSTFSASILDAPALIAKNGKMLTFSNPGNNIYSTTVGIYKDGKVQQQIEVDGINAFPNSIIELLQGKGSVLGQTPELTTYEMKDDGQYDIKMRTGLPLNDDGTPEYEDAFETNLERILGLIVDAFVPIDVTGTKSCAANLVKNLSGAELADFKKEDAPTAVRDLVNLALSDIDVFIKCADVSAATLDETYFKDVLQYYDLAGKFGIGANLSYYAIQWSLAAPAFDTCYMVKGDMVSKCCGAPSDTTFTDPRDGQVYTVKKYGSQTWMTQNLNYKSANSSCYDNDQNNCSIYGQLYPQIDLNIIAPPGWHVATSDDWKKLLVVLGGKIIDDGTEYYGLDPFGNDYYDIFNNVGDKMRNTCSNLWQSPNAGATNSSGFNALPGGLIYGSGNPTYMDLGSSGEWYTSNMIGNYQQYVGYTYYFCSLDDNSDTLLIEEQFTTVIQALSVRCVKN